MLWVAVAWIFAGAGASPSWSAQSDPQKGQTDSQKDAGSQSPTEPPAAALPAAALQSGRDTSAPAPDLTARKRAGKASFYARQFAGKPMANGAPMDPRGNNAASRSLPLGTTAKVTNVETGKTAVVKIEDRGPYVDGRLVDLSPGTAEEIGLTPRKGVTRVVVAPITVPLPGGKVKLGAAAHEPQNEPDTLPLPDEKAGKSNKNAAAISDTDTNRPHRKTELAAAAGASGARQDR
jgi:rare lipoprotein A